MVYNIISCYVVCRKVTRPGTGITYIIFYNVYQAAFEPPNKVFLEFFSKFGLRILNLGIK